MNCADARHRILTAELSALRGQSDAILAAHLASCADCATAVSSVIADTARLRSAVVARGRRPEPARARRRLALSLIPVALAAEIALIVFFSQRSAPSRIEGRAIDDSVTTMLPATVAGSDTDRAVPAGRLPVQSLAPATRRPVGVSRNAPGARPAAIRGPIAQAESSMSRVQVTMADRHQRAAIIATSNPKVTVVWLTKGDSL